MAWRELVQALIARSFYLRTASNRCDSNISSIWAPHDHETHEPVPSVLHSGLRGSAHGHSVSAPPLGGLESTERGSALGSGADRPRADSAPGAVGRNAPCASQHGKRVKVVGIRARANCVSVRRREAPGAAPWVPHTHGASLCRRRAAPVAHRPTWLLASSPVEALVPGMLELWFEETEAAWWSWAGRAPR